MSKQDPWLRKWGAGAMSHPSNPGCPPHLCGPRPQTTLGAGDRQAEDAAGGVLQRPWG